MSRAIFAVITVSDSCFNKIKEDESGPCLKRLVKEIFSNAEIQYEIVPDDQSVIEQILVKYVKEIEPQAIFTTGGTGFGPRDVTPEATKSIIHRECPQLTLAMSLESFKKTPFAALSRAVCGIRDRTLIINFPGSIKAVQECFGAIKTVLPHAIQLICNDLKLVKKVHEEIQQGSHHVCPHKVGKGDGTDRSSIYPMLPLKDALEIIFQIVRPNTDITAYLNNFKSPVNIPPFRASIKDGYALKSSGDSGVKRVLGRIEAGDKLSTINLGNNDCFKINTGAWLPEDADCVIQVEDTKLVETNKDGEEKTVEILVKPKPFLDVRPVGCDLKKNSTLFPMIDLSDVVMKSLFASVGEIHNFPKPKIAIISTGSELMAPCEKNVEFKIYDSNMTMLGELLKYFGFQCTNKILVGDKYDEVKSTISSMMSVADFIICTGGVSMGDKDYIKPALNDLGFKIQFGRVNMKPGKPMTFASFKDKKYFFGLPGNPVSAFVTFHIFVLPALRWASGWERNKCELSTIQVKLENDQLELDPRPEFVRASISNRNGQLFGNVIGNQMSSRLQSIVGADVLLHVPGRTESKKFVTNGELLNASVLRYDFISKYE